MSRTWTSTFDVDRARSAAQEGATEGLEQATRHVFGVSQRMVPFTKGRLSASGKVRMLSATRSAIVYDYPGAIDAHERTEIRPANGRQRKFLETAMNSERARATAIIAAAIRRRLGT